MRTLIVLSLGLLPLAASAGPKEDAIRNLRARRAAIELFQSNSPAAAVAHLQQNLRPEPGPSGDSAALAQNLIEIACEFYNRRDLKGARDAIAQALTVAEPLLNGRNPVSAVRRADFYASLGLLQETVMFAPQTALAYYDAALALNPSDKHANRRKGALVEKQKHQKGGGR